MSLVRLAFGLAAIGSFSFALSCSSSSSTGGSSGSSGSPADAGGDAATPTDSGTTPAALNGCTVGKNYADHTAASDPRTLDWDFSIATSPNRCMTITAGQTVTWQKPGGGAPDLLTHPLQASGGDTPNPIANIDAQSGRVTFATKGVFGYQCGNHPAMTGAIQVE